MTTWQPAERASAMDGDDERLVCVVCTAPTPTLASELSAGKVRGAKRRARHIAALCAGWRCAACLTEAGA